MQTLVFTRALDEIVQELKVHELIDLVEPWLNAPGAIVEEVKNRFSDLIFGSYAGYERLRRRPTTRVILEKLEIGKFYDVQRLRLLVSHITNIQQNQQAAVPIIHTFLDLLHSFLRIRNACKDLLEEGKIGAIPSTDAVLEIELIQYADEDGISPKRLEIFVACVTRLHSSLAIVYGVTSDQLRLKYFDSGSDLVVGLQAAKPIIEALGTLLSQLWDRFRFRHFDTADRKFSTVSEGLIVMEKVKEAVQNQTITAEEGQLLKTSLFNDVEKLLGIGAMLPVRDNATNEQRQMLTAMRDTKLLGSGDPEPANASSDSAPSA